MRPSRSGQHQLRIVGGRHRGRRLPVLDQPGLRPTADRVRETLFNWVAPTIAEARCLDLFAGSGALGLEACSRGAGEVVLIERAAAAARQLEVNVRTLGERSVEVVRADALDWLATTPPRPFDLIFLDPPFAADLLAPALTRLIEDGWVAPGGRLYVERGRQEGLPEAPPGWVLLRDKCAGQVRYGLLAEDLE